MKYVYNGLGQKVQQIEDQGGLSLVTSYSYYTDGELHTVTDAEQKVTTYTYDALGRVKTVQDALSQATGYTYDAAGNLRSLTDAKTQTSSFSYNGLGSITGDTRPMGQSTTYSYTESGKLEAKTGARGQRTEYLYEDGTNLLTDIYYFDENDVQSGHVSFSYERGQLSGYDDGEISASYDYNAFGQKLSETVNYPDFSKTFSYTYDNSGQKRSFTMPDGDTVSYSYDDANQLSSVRVPGAGSVSYPSYTLGRPDSMSSPGDTRSYAYDALARLEDLDSASFDASYSYDDAGNILTKTTGDGTYEYDYDDLYRLTDVTDPVSDDETYTYDAVGNRASASNTTGDIEHNANNELNLYGDISFDYDANGNLTAKTSASESWAYSDNVRNRLVRVEENDLLIAEYGYDPFGRRLWKEVDGERTYFLYADEGLVAEYDEEGVELRSYGYKPDSTWGTDPLWLKEGGEYYWYQNDDLGTPQKLVDSSGTVVWSAIYSAFGEASIDIETVTNNLRFPGQYYDEETGLHYNWFRYYDPEIGRYTKIDPIGFSGGEINLYGYGRNNPIIFRDVDGRLVIDPSCKMFVEQIKESEKEIKKAAKKCLPSTEKPEKAHYEALIKLLDSVTVKCENSCLNEEEGVGYCGMKDEDHPNTFTLTYCGLGDKDAKEKYDVECPTCTTGTILEELLHLLPELKYDHDPYDRRVPVLDGYHIPSVIKDCLPGCSDEPEPYLVAPDLMG